MLLNLSASNITLRQGGDTAVLMGAQSICCIGAYAYSAAGPGESTTDLAWGGHAAIFEMGEGLAETQRFPTDSTMIHADVDVERIRSERIRTGFQNQFKRSAVPNGPKISCGVSLSPRGDWRMPSDASPAAWLEELAANTPDGDPGPAPLA